MPHLSDGDLHAWLDGAIAGTSGEGESLRLHLEACTDCASRLEGARELKAQSASILASAVPSDAVPSFEEVRRKARAGSMGDGRKSGFHLLRGPWLSAQRLSWAATVALALGAGWMGRAVLEERGWTDPFHEGPPAVASRTLDAETDSDDAAEVFAREQAAFEEKGSDVGGRTDAQGVGKESGVDRQAVLKDEVAPSNVVGQTPERDADVGTPADPPAAAPQRTGVLAQAEEPLAESVAVAAVGEVAAADELAASPEAERLDYRAKSVQKAGDPWHALPEVRLSAPPGAAGCYRIEYSWSPGVANLPGAVKLVTEEPEGWKGQSVFAIVGRGGQVPDLYEATWSSMHPDSIWVQLVSASDRDVITVRAERSGSDWEGESRVLRPGGRVSVGQERGTVRLVGITCEPS